MLFILFQFDPFFICFPTFSFLSFFSFASGTIL